MSKKRLTRTFKRKWSILCFSIMLIFACCLNFATAETINISDYPYRFGLVVPNATTNETFPKGALTNVYLRLDDADGTPAPFINTASLISQGKMRSDCGDIRVADKDGNVYKTNIGGCNSGYTALTVYVPLVPANNSLQLYMYYGNPTASPKWDYSTLFVDNPALTQVTTLNQFASNWFQCHNGSCYINDLFHDYWPRTVPDIVPDTNGWISGATEDLTGDITVNNYGKTVKRYFKTKAGTYYVTISAMDGGNLNEYDPSINLGIYDLLTRQQVAQVWNGWANGATSKTITLTVPQDIDALWRIEGTKSAGRTTEYHITGFSYSDGAGLEAYTIPPDHTIYSKIVTGKQGELPQINGLSCPATANLGEVINCSVSASVPTGTLKYKWIIAGGTPDSPNSSSTNITVDSTGTKTVKVKVWTQELGEGTAIYGTTQVIVNDPISLVNVVCPTTAYTSQDITCTSTVVKDESMTYRYVWTTDGNVTENDTNSAKIRWLSPGNGKYVKLRVEATTNPTVFKEHQANVDVESLFRIDSVNCPSTLKMGETGICTVVATTSDGTLNYQWGGANAVITFPDIQGTSLYFTEAGTKLVNVTIHLRENPSRTKTAYATVNVTPVNTSLTVDCPTNAGRYSQIACTAAGSSDWGEIAFLWDADADGNIIGANDTDVANVAFSTIGNHSVRARMYLQEAPHMFIERVANIVVTVPPPTIYNVGCTEEVYLGQKADCSISASASNGTLKLLWNAAGANIDDSAASTTGILFNAPGGKTVSINAYIKEYPSIAVNTPLQVTVLDNPVTVEVACPDTVLARESFTCTVQGSALWGTPEYTWVTNNAVATTLGSTANIKAGKEGLASVKVTASLVETPSIKKEVIKAIKVIGEGSIAPAIKGDRTVYIEAQNTYKVIAPCVTGSTYTIKQQLNKKKTARDTLNVSFLAPGKYEIQAETTLTGTELTKTETITVNAVNLPRIPVSISGQKAVFVGEEYAYTAVIPEKYRGLDVRILWTLPDGSTVEGKQVTMAPTAEGTYSLKCEGWVNSHRDETLKTAQYKITAVGYNFPMPKINVKKTEGLGPYNVTFKIDYTVKKIMGLQYRITYNWNFGDGETLTTTNTVVHHLFTKVGTYNVTMSAVDQYDNTTTDNVTITVGAAPIGIGFKVSASNKYMRAPLKIYVRSAISKKMPLDSLESYVWKIDGVVAENTKSEYLRVTFGEPGDHTVTYTATMKSGATATDSVDIAVNPNQSPTCTIDHTLGVGSYVYLKAKCTDPDGRISAYKWNLDDGRGYRNGSANISFKAPATRTYSIVLKAIDDSGEEVEFTKEIAVTRE